MGRPHLVNSRNVSKLYDQRFIEPIGLYKGVKSSIMGISNITNFDIINLVEESMVYEDLVGRPWGRKMKETISIEKDRIKLKGNGIIIIIPTYLEEGKHWSK